MSVNLFVGDYGTVLEITVIENGKVVDLSNATEIVAEIAVRKTRIASEITRRIVRACVVVGDGTDGRVNFVIQQGDLSDPGVYEFRLRLTFPAGKWSTSIVRMPVSE